jgi:mono/diheme cytochrome c family protein
MLRALLLAARAVPLALPVLLAEVTAAGAQAEVRFADEIRPIFNKNCVACHGGVKRAADISFIVPDLVVARGPGDTKKPIQPGAPAKSEIIRRITSKDPKVRMPPPEHGRALTDGEIEKMRTWIAQGAKWEPHWAFVPPKLHTPPRVEDSAWAPTDMDRFVLARIEAAGLKPSPAASRRAWLRRVSFDLTGLPPTLEEIAALENDPEPNARDKVVDRLLASSGFGERWATVWLDLARYADSMGFEKDPLRTVWPWRDWVIRSLNANMPFDEFTLRQLAGDLMPGNTFEDLIATAFHRNTQNNTEGGTDDEEFRIAAVLDRLNTTFEAWQSLTFKCAQCHSHPYEPIEQKEYYQAAAFFNNTRDWDLREDYPLLRVPVNTNEFCQARELDRRTSEWRRGEFAQARQLKSATSWLSLRPVKVESDKGTKLAIDGNAEIRTDGTVAHYSKFTVEAEAPATKAAITAFRLEALPTEPDRARLTPEMGFVVSFFRSILLPQGEVASSNTNTNADGKKEEDAKEEEKSLGILPGEIILSHAFGDEAEPFDDAEQILDPDPAGWGPLPRTTGTRQIVFVPREPVAIPAGSRLKFLIFHDQGPGDFAALVMRRFNLSIATNTAWTEFVRNEEFATRRTELFNAGCRRAGIENVEMPVIAEQEPQMKRNDAVFIRGNWLDKGPEVSARVPAIYPHWSRGPNRIV